MSELQQRRLPAARGAPTRLGPSGGRRSLASASQVGAPTRLGPSSVNGSGIAGRQRHQGACAALPQWHHWQRHPGEAAALGKLRHAWRWFSQQHRHSLAQLRVQGLESSWVNARGEYQFDDSRRQPGCWTKGEKIKLGGGHRHSPYQVCVQGLETCWVNTNGRVSIGRS